MGSLAILADASVGRHCARSTRSMRVGRTGAIAEAGPTVSLRTDEGEAKPQDRTHGR